MTRPTPTQARWTATAARKSWGDFAARADKEGWPAARLLTALAEHEIAERDRRRTERHLAEAKLPAGKTLDTFAFEAVPMVSKAQVMAMWHPWPCAWDSPRKSVFQNLAKDDLWN